jgi:ubiquinone/menaquinone biosynthesis C-methylase UbiE
MEPPPSAKQQYVLGSQADELARLDRQAAFVERPTRMLLQAAGIAPGMRVLDLGTGLGHVARLAAELAGPRGSVVGIDQSAEMLSVASERTRQAEAANVEFVQATADGWRASEPFDAIVGRLLLFHVSDPIAVVRHQLLNLRPGGLFVAIDFDIGACRAEPAVPIVTEARRFTSPGSSDRPLSVGSRRVPERRSKD